MTTPYASPQYRPVRVGFRACRASRAASTAHSGEHGTGLVRRAARSRASRDSAASAMPGATLSVTWGTVRHGTCCSAVAAASPNIVRT
jgi:hypothetical protein